MAQAASFVTNPDSFATCSLAGLPVVSGKLVEFQQIASALREQISQLDKEKNRAAWAKRGLFAAQLIKAACDGFIATADAIVDTPQTNAIAKAYELGTDVAGTVSSAATIGVSKADLAKVALNRAAAGVKGKLPDGEWKEAGEAAVDLHKFQSLLLVDSVNSDPDAAISDLVSVSAAVGKLAAAGAKSKPLKRFFGAGEAIANTARSFVKFYKDFKEDDDEKMFEGLKRSLNQQIKVIEKKIGDLQKAILDWEQERASRLPPIKTARR